MADIWFAAVYTNHHYVLDVAAGAACALIGIASFAGLRWSRLVAAFASGLLQAIT